MHRKIVRQIVQQCVPPKSRLLISGPSEGKKRRTVAEHSHNLGCLCHHENFFPSTPIFHPVLIQISSTFPLDIYGISGGVRTRWLDAADQWRTCKKSGKLILFQRSFFGTAQIATQKIQFDSPIISKTFFKIIKCTLKKPVLCQHISLHNKNCFVLCNPLFPKFSVLFHHQHSPPLSSAFISN